MKRLKLSGNMRTIHLDENGQSIVNRIPPLTNVEEWARAMFKLGLAYHLDDDPSDIVDTSTNDVLGPPMFSHEEAEHLSVVTSKFSQEDRETYFKTVLEEVHKTAIQEHPPCQSSVCSSRVKKAE